MLEQGYTDDLAEIGGNQMVCTDLLRKLGAGEFVR